MGREIRTLLRTMESNLSEVVPNHDAVIRKDEKTKTTYRENFDKRHGASALPELQPRDSVCVKLDQQKGWKTQEESLQRVLLLDLTLSRRLRNIRRLKLVPDTDRFTKPVE